MKKYYVLIVAVVLLVLVGLFMPLQSYTTTKGCGQDPTPTERLHLILGDSIEEVKSNDIAPAPNEGCWVNTKYILYLL